MTCDICGIKLKTGNTLGVCCAPSGPCKAERQRRQPKSPERRCCEICGKPVQANNLIGVCRRNEACKKESTRRHNKAYARTTTQACSRCGRPTYSLMGVCWRKGCKGYRPWSKCLVEDCDRKIARKDEQLCGMHLYRKRKYGHPLRRGKALIRVRPSDGYAYIRGRDGGECLWHRIVMAGIIGRELLPHENVHHINGVRDDNRPENLELWSSSQPAGQRVADKLAWAREMIALYADLEAVAMSDGL